MQDELIFHSEEEYNAYVLKELEDASREAADPNTKWIPLDEFLREAEEYVCELENRRIARSA